MKDTFRQSMKWFHTWVGLVVGWILFFMFITGSTGYFYKEITRYMEPERPLISYQLSKDEMLDKAQQYMSIHASDLQEWDVFLPNRRDANLQVGWRHAPKAGERRGWAILLIYPAYRPKAKAWSEQLNLAAAVFIFLPILNVLTTDKHLGITLSHGDWHYAGFDLAMLVIGLTFAFAGFKFKSSQSKRTRVRQTKTHAAIDNDLVLNKENKGAL